MRAILMLILILACHVGLLRCSAAQDAIHSHLFTPDWLIQHRGSLEVTDEQLEAIQTLVEELRPRVSQQENRLRVATAGLENSLAENEDETRTLEALAKLAAVEQEMRESQVRLMVRLRKLLTPQQRQLALRLKRSKQPTVNVQQRLQSKMRRLQQEMQQRSTKGESFPDVARQMQSFPQLLQQGQVARAENILNNALRGVGIDPDLVRARELPKTEFKQIDLPPLAQRSAAEVQTAVRDLQREDVAWRKIPWKACLLEGLKASKNERKPIILWVFIDRPFDDERC